MDDLDSRLSRLSRNADVNPRILDELVISTRDVARSTLRHRLVAGVTAGLLVLGAGAAAAPAAADAVREFLAQSDQQFEEGGEILPDSEVVDLSASDLRAYIDYVFPEDLPIPPSQTREWLGDRTYEMSNASNTVAQEVSLRRQIETLAYCGWVVEYLDAERHGDDRRTDAAAVVLVAAADWPALVATDGGGIMDRYRNAGDSVEAGEFGAGHTAFRAGECDVLGFESMGDK